jgi:hypothetical protein
LVLTFSFTAYLLGVNSKTLLGFGALYQAAPCRIAAPLRVVGVDKWSIGSAGTGIYGEAAVDGEEGGTQAGGTHGPRETHETGQAHKTEPKAESGRETQNDAKRQS